MKIITIVGARPQFVKASVVSRALRAHAGIEEMMVHTGQHFDPLMSALFFEELEIPEPTYNLGIHAVDHATMTGRMMEKMETVFQIEKPDWVLVYGDTNSTLAGALTARKMHLKVAHVEAGLRSWNMAMPEEVNRAVTDRISDLLFCPTDKAVANLEREGFSHLPVDYLNVGDVMQDAANLFSTRQRKPDIDIPGHFILCTVHRAENTDDPDKLKNIFQALESLSRHFEIVFPLHPRTKQTLEDTGYDMDHSPVNFIPPVGYLEMVWLLNHTRMVITDSGGLQKEAYFFEKNCITLRNETEWTELVDRGVNILAGSDAKKITDAFVRFSTQNNSAFKEKLYGDGKAAEKIAEELLRRM